MSHESFVIIFWLSSKKAALSISNARRNPARNEINIQTSLFSKKYFYYHSAEEAAEI